MSKYNVNFTFNNIPVSDRGIYNFENGSFQTSEFVDDIVGYSGELCSIEIEVFPYNVYNLTETQFSNFYITFFNLTVYPGALLDNCEGYSGSVGSIFQLNDTDSIDSDGYSGGYADVDFLTNKQFYSVFGYAGEHSDCDFTNNPFDKLEPRAYSGGYVDSYLRTEQSFWGVGYSGGYGETTLKTSQLFYPDYCYSGGYADCDFITAPSLELSADGYSGGYSDADVYIPNDTRLTQVFGYAGSYANCDVVINPQKEFVLNEATDGGYGESYIKTVQSFFTVGYSGEYSESFLNIIFPFGEVIGYSGEYSEGDITLNPPDLIDSDSYSGEIVDCVLNSFSTRLDGGVCYDGGYSDCDFTNNPLDKFEPVGYSGEYAEAFLNIEVIIFPRGNSGEYGDCDLTENPSKWINSVGYDGGVGEVDQLTEDTFYGYCYDGVVGEIDAIEFSDFNAFGYSGSYSESDLWATLSFWMRYALDGTNNRVDFKTYRACDSTAYSGEFSDCVFTDNPADEFEPVAFDGIYGHLDLQPKQVHKLDAIGYAGEFGFDYWTTFNFYYGSPFYFDFTSIDFAFDKNTPYPWQFPYGGIGEEAVVSLTQTQRLDIFGYAGEIGEVEYNGEALFYDVVGYSGEYFESNIDSEFYIRFCYGYLLPSGKEINFEYTSEIDRSCASYYGYAGEKAEWVGLSTKQVMWAQGYDGVYAEAYMNIAPWQPITGYDGAVAQVGVDVIYTLDNVVAYDGCNGYAEFFYHNHFIYAGEYSEADLTLGYWSIQFITPSDRCLENVYRPLDDDGYYDYNYVQIGNFIEEQPVISNIKALCIKEPYIWNSFMPTGGSGEVGECDMRMYAKIENEYYSGEFVECSLYVENMDNNGFVGEYLDASLSISVGLQ